MSTFRHLIAQTLIAAEPPRVTPIDARIDQPINERIDERAQRRAVSPATSIHQDQIQALVQQLFFRHPSGPVRHVGFAPVEASSTATATLCLEVATALAEEDRYDVGLIDTHSDSSLLQTELQIPSPNPTPATWPLGPRLWMVPRQSWLADGRGRITDQNLSRLRELTAEFDFSILWCAPVSWLTASIGQSCDGLVLVLTANKTRRLVAAQIKDQLSKAQVPLLGTVLAERRFPVPRGLYRSL